MDISVLDVSGKTSNGKTMGKAIQSRHNIRKQNINTNIYIDPVYVSCLPVVLFV